MKKAILFLGVVGSIIGCSAQAKDHGVYVGAGYGIVDVPKVDGVSFSDADNGALQLGYRISGNFSIEAQYSKSVKNSSAKSTLEDVDISEVWWESVQALNPGTTLAQAQSWFPYAVADMAMDFEASIETTAIYAVYRSAGNLYFKLKGGYLSEKSTLTASVDSFDLFVAVSNADPIEINAGRGDESFSQLGGDQKERISERESDFSAGIGAGYKFTDNLFSEVEFTRLNDDLDFISINLNFAF